MGSSPSSVVNSILQKSTCLWNIYCYFLILLLYEILQVLSHVELFFTGAPDLMLLGQYRLYDLGYVFTKLPFVRTVGIYRALTILLDAYLFQRQRWAGDVLREGCSYLKGSGGDVNRSVDTESGVIRFRMCCNTGNIMPN
jgi:hypothetical protein